LKGALRVFGALAEAGIDARPVVYDESFADEVKRDLLAANGVFVWVDPIHRVRRARNSTRCCGRSPRLGFG
jgi:hypothetical protein